jgi:serine/threonine-protein kinase
MATSGGDQRRTRFKTLRSHARSLAQDSVQITGAETTSSSSGEQPTMPSRAGHVRPAVSAPIGRGTARAEPMRAALTPGTLVGGRFILIQEIGRGSTGIVFEMRHNELGHRVAIKALHPHIVDNPNIMWRFKREAQLTASLKHPNIVSVFDVSQQFDSIYFIVQEFLEGVSFRRLLQQQGRLSVAETLDYLAPIMGALVAAHHKGIVHRDVKPENIFLSQLPSGAVIPKLIDFGLAKIASEKGELETQMGAVLGTPSYMSPEQALGKKVNTQADVWSLGVVFFEALAGQRPFYSDAVSSTMDRVRQGDPKPLSLLAPHVPTELADIVHRALERDLTRRFASMFEFLTAIVRFAERADPAFSSRHIASIPRSLVSSAASPADEVEPVSIRRGRSLSQSTVVAVRTKPALGSETDTDAEGKSAPTIGTDVLAEQALEMNALTRASDLAEQAIGEQPSSLRIEGRMRLVQAIACRWLGKLVESERYGRLAYQRLPRGSSRWFAAVETLLVVLAAMGQGEQLTEIIDALLAARAIQSPVAVGAQVRALGQATISSIRTGRDGLADRAFDLAQTLAQALPYDEVDVRVWLDLAEAELALHAGDHVGFLSLVNLSVETFAARGDTRNACLYRAHMGRAYLALGAYSRAERELRSAIGVGEPMRLGFLVPVRANLALTLARLGRLREATTAAREALKECVERGDEASLPTCRSYLAEILRVSNQLVEAEAQAAEAVADSARMPSLRAAALATLANIVLQGGRADTALADAVRAMSLLQSLKGDDAGDGLIRLVYVRALAATGQRAKARVHLTQARAQLARRAVRISDPRWQKTFLEEIPENRELTALDIQPTASPA